jgi:hypothetical protein
MERGQQLVQLSSIDRGQQQLQLGGMERGQQLQLDGLERGKQLVQLGGMESGQQQQQVDRIERGQQQLLLGSMNTRGPIDGTARGQQQLQLGSIERGQQQLPLVCMDTMGPFGSMERRQQQLLLGSVNTSAPLGRIIDDRFQRQHLQQAGSINPSELQLEQLDSTGIDSNGPKQEQPSGNGISTPHQQHQVAVSSKRRNRVCKNASCNFCSIPPCGTCGPCMFPAKKSKCILRYDITFCQI